MQTLKQEPTYYFREARDNVNFINILKYNAENIVSNTTASYKILLYIY